jgi:hypothetical protein
MKEEKEDVIGESERVDLSQERSRVGLGEVDMYTSIYICIDMYTSIYICIDMYTSIYICICINICI